MVKVDVDLVLLDLDGKPVVGKVGRACPTCGHTEEAEDLTVGSALVQALTHTQREDTDGTEKFNRFVLAQEVRKAKGEISLSAENVVMLKGLVGRLFNVVVTGRLFTILEGEADG